MDKEENIHQLTAHLFRKDAGKMVAVLSRIFGLKQIDTVMDVVQDTFETALSTWRFSGIPDNPSAWLMRVAKNKSLNTFKRENKTQSISPSLYIRHFEEGFNQRFDTFLLPKEIEDSQLRLLFACCYPDLSEKNQVIITLNILCGFGVPEIANALLMNEEAVKKALARSRATLRGLDTILETNIITQSEERIRTVRTILYLMFNEGYKTTRAADAINNDLCFESIRLTRLLYSESSTSARETDALLALMFFNLSRFPARIHEEDGWLNLEEQDRKLWDRVFIEEGYHYLEKATQSGSLHRFHLEAIIASLHCAAPTFEETNWEKIAWLYCQLEILEPASPLVTLNRIIAESYLEGNKSMNELDTMESQGLLKDGFLLEATRGDIFKRRGDLLWARKAYEKALLMAVSPADKKFLKRKILQCDPGIN